VVATNFIFFQNDLYQLLLHLDIFLSIPPPETFLFIFFILPSARFDDLIRRGLEQKQFLLFLKKYVDLNLSPPSAAAAAALVL
jgi:hypothetical protein